MSTRDATVLVVDDEASVRRLVVHQLEPLECRTLLEAGEGEEARRILDSREVDVVVTDLLMPVLDGLGLMRWAREDHPDVEWIVLSGLETFGSAVEALQLGAFDFLTKPLHPERLRVSVRNALDKVQMERERRELLERLDRGNRHLRERVEQLQVCCDVLERQATEIDRDLERAEAIQRALLPSELPALGAFRVETLYRPGRHVGGDLYDVTAIGDHHIALLVADACGHGMSAAMLSVLFKQRLQLRDELNDEPFPPSVALARVNDVLVSTAPDGMFVTAACAVLDTETGWIEVASAGHPPLLWAREGGRVETLERTGPALGVEAGAHYDEIQLELERGDRLLLFTDGVLGVHGAGLGRVREAIQSAPSLTALLSGLREGALAGEHGSDLDDATAVALEARVGASRLDTPVRVSGRAPVVAGARLYAGQTLDGAWLRISGRGTWREAEDFLVAVREALEAAPRLRIDLSECTHLDSTFLGTLHEAVMLAESADCPLWLVGPGPALWSLFDELCMDRVMLRVCEGEGPPASVLRPVAMASPGAPGERVLRAHEALASLCSGNSEAFRAVIEGLRAELSASES